MRGTVLIVAAVYLVLAAAFLAVFILRVPLEFRPFVAFAAQYLGAVLRGLPFVLAAAAGVLVWRLFVARFVVGRLRRQAPVGPAALVLGVLNPVSIVAVLLMFQARPAPAVGALIFAPLCAVLTALILRIAGMGTAFTQQPAAPIQPSRLLLEECFEGLRALAIAGLFAAALHNFLPVPVSTYLYRNPVPASLALAVFWLLFPVPRGVHAALAPLFVGRFPAVAVSVYLGLGLILHGRELRGLYELHGRVYTVLVIGLLVSIMLLLSVPAAGLLSL